jgi:8-oxo-dGTP pyrophosphatase MutT (NUDIX family)
MLTPAQRRRLAEGFMRHIEACNPVVDEPFVPWRIDEHTVGWLRPVFVERLQAFPQVFEIESADDTGSAVRLQGHLQGFEERSAALREVALQLAADAVTPLFMDEPFPVTPSGRDAALCALDRGAAAHFGLRSFGQHLNGFVRGDDGIRMWLGRRARDRLLFPGALDNMVAGGLPHDLGLHENLLKECEEEAGVPADLAATALPVGLVSYNRVAERGFRRDVLYCYDLEVPAGFVPRNNDGEVESFALLPLDEVARLVSETDEFKLNCNLVVIDFLIRHGWLDPEAPVYLPLVHGLRQPMAERP